MNTPARTTTIIQLIMLFLCCIIPLFNCNHEAEYYEWTDEDLARQEELCPGGVCPSGGGGGGGGIDGLVGEWLFSGNADDTSGNGNNGSVNGATLTADRFGVSNRAGSFGTSSTIQFSTDNGFPAGSSSRTLSFWVKAPNSFTDEYNCIFHYGTMSANAAFTIYSWYATSLGWDINGGFITYIPSSQAFDDSWHHIVILYDGSNAKIFVDATVKDTKAATLNTVLSGTAMIGKVNAGSVTMSGSIDDIRLYDRALSDVEISNLFHEGGW